MDKRIQVSQSLYRATRRAESGVQAESQNADGEAFTASPCDVLRDTAQAFIGEGGIRTPSEISLNTTVYDHSGAESGALVVNDPDLSFILQAWALLPQPIKAGILAMVRASGG